MKLNHEPIKINEKQIKTNEKQLHNVHAFLFFEDSCSFFVLTSFSRANGATHTHFSRSGTLSLPCLLACLSALFVSLRYCEFVYKVYKFIS